MGLLVYSVSGKWTIAQCFYVGKLISIPIPINTHPSIIYVKFNQYLTKIHFPSFLFTGHQPHGKFYLKFFIYRTEFSREGKKNRNLRKLVERYRGRNNSYSSCNIVHVCPFSVHVRRRWETCQYFHMKCSPK